LNQSPSGIEPCCLPSVDGVTYIKVGSRGVTIGMLGLDKVFLQLLEMNRHPDQVTDTELVGMARKFNYIPERETVEADYAVALRRVYASFYAQQELKP
jgi:hypothetical protein